MPSPESNISTNPEADFILDRSLPLEQRLDMARYLAQGDEPTVVPVAVLATWDGNDVRDKHVSEEQLMDIVNSYGFLPDTHSGTECDKRTPSSIHPDLTLQITEEPLDMGPPSAMFPNGKAWSPYDYTIRVNILVSPRNLA